MGGLFLVGFWYFTIKFLKNEISFKINTKLWKFTLFLLAVTIGAAVFTRLLGNIFTENLNFIPFLFTEFIVIKNVLIKILFLSGLVLLCAGAGKKIFDIFKFNIEDKKEEFIFSFGLGFLIINYFAFFLTASGWFYFLPSLALVIIFTIFSSKQIKYFVDNFLKAEFQFNISADFKDIKNLESWIWIIITTFLIAAIIPTFRSFLINYDDLAAYFSIPQLYIYYHSLVPFYNAPAAIPSGIAMPLYSLINMLFAPHFVFHLSWLFLIFTLCALYLFTSKFFSQKAAITTLLLVVFVPWNNYFIITQKIDFIFTFISAIAVFSFFIWLNNKDVKSSTYFGWLYLCAVFLGYAISLKINGLFLIASIFLVVAGLFIFKKINFKKSAIFGLIIFLFFLPILAFNIYYYNNPVAPFKIFSSAQKTETLFNQNKKVTMYDIFNKTDFAAKRNRDLTVSGYQNNTNNSAIIKFFWRIWNTTINQKGYRSINIEITPYLLIFLPFFLFYFIKNRLYKEKNIFYLSIISLAFFSLWYLKGAERPWYGIGMFYFLFIFCGLTLEKIKNKKYAFVICSFIILFCFRTFTGLIKDISTQPNTIYSSPAYQKKYDDIPDFRMYDFINKEIIAKNDKALILMFLGPQIANIQGGDQKTIIDNSSIYWGKIVQETESLKDIKNILTNQKITHISYNINFKNKLISITQNNPESKLSEEIKIFEKFKNKYLKEIHCEQEQLRLYEIRE
ncbi:MAG: hypothetical protein ABIC82_02440 [bacterium]